MGCVGSKTNVDKAVDAAAENKDKVVDAVQAVGAKAGVSQEALASTSTKVEAALADKQGLKDTLNKALGSGDATPAAYAAPATAAA